LVVINLDILEELAAGLGFGNEELESGKHSVLRLLKNASTRALS